VGFEGTLMLQGEQIWQTLSREPVIIDSQEVDLELLWEQYFKRQRLLGEILQGNMHPDDLLDCMLDDGMSPDVYLEEVDLALLGVMD
jgi:hypothetical protein